MFYLGVIKIYVIQVGCEFCVIVGVDKIDDKQMENLLGEIVKKIQDEMIYLGQVKIIVICEICVVSFVK